MLRYINIQTDFFHIYINQLPKIWKFFVFKTNKYQYVTEEFFNSKLNKYKMPQNHKNYIKIKTNNFNATEFYFCNHKKT